MSNTFGKRTQDSNMIWNPQPADVVVQEKWTLLAQALCFEAPNHDYGKNKRSAAARSSLVGIQATTRKNNLPSFSELLALSSHRLISLVQLSRFLPIYVKQAWIRQIRAFDLKRWQASLDIFDELSFDQRCAEEDYQPGRNTGEGTFSQHQAFNAEMICFRHELNTIKIILQYVVASAREA